MFCFYSFQIPSNYLDSNWPIRVSLSVNSNGESTVERFRQVPHHSCPCTAQHRIGFIYRATTLDKSVLAPLQEPSKFPQFSSTPSTMLISNALFSFKIIPDSFSIAWRRVEGAWCSVCLIE